MKVARSQSKLMILGIAATAFLAATSAQADDPPMEEVVVVGVAIKVTITYPAIDIFWSWWNDYYEQMQQQADQADPDNEEKQMGDWGEKHKDLNCSSPMAERADYATGAAGFADVGTTYYVNYPGGGRQQWIVSSRTLLSYTVQAIGDCIGS